MIDGSASLKLLSTTDRTMRIVYMGTPEFAVPGLIKLYRSGAEIAAVVSRPDRPAGRGMKMKPPPVKDTARELGIKVLQPSSLKSGDFIGRMRTIAPDLIVVSAYGKYIPRKVIETARRGAINLHPSLLPLYRGAAPIQRALINGDERTGVSVIAVAEKMDAGDIYGQMPVPILPEDTAESLSRRLAGRGGDLLVEIVGDIEAGKASPRPQDESEATNAPRLTKEDGLIDWNLTAVEISNRVRGLNPWPGAYTRYRKGRTDKNLKIISCRPVEGSGAPGTVIEAEGGKLIVAAGRGAVDITLLQAEGKKILKTEEFLRGTNFTAGEKLGQGDG